MEDPNRSALVVKSNALVSAMVDLSLMANRFLAFSISRLPRDLTPEPGKPVELEIPVLEFAEAFEIPPTNIYREIEELADKLQRKLITLQADQTLNGRRVKVGLITKQEYHDGEGRVWVRFDEDLVPHLVGLREQFTQYLIKDVYQFGSAHTWRVYELLKQFKEAGKREIEIEDFKRMTATIGKYPRPTDLKARVIDPAVEEINATSDIQVQYEQKKRGRRITGFTFIIRDNPKTKAPQERIRAAAESLDNGQDLSPSLAKTLAEEYQVSQKQARQLANLSIGQEERILAKLPKIKARFEKLKDKKTNLGGYIFNALKDELTPKQGALPI